METQQLASAGIGEWDILLQFLLGAAAAFGGYLISQKLKRATEKNELTLNVISGLCFAGTASILVEIAEFFIDFYKGTNLLHADLVTNEHWLYRLVGTMMSLDGQRYLLDTDEDMLMTILGGIVATAGMYIYQRIKNKPMFVKEKKLKTKSSFGAWVQNKFAVEKEKLARDCSVADILLWWCTRAVMLYAFIVMENRAEATLLCANLIATFTITLVHIVFPEGTFFSRISYRTQSLITVIVFLGSWCGNFVWLYGIVSRFDLFLHLISGVLCTLGGYYIALTLVRPDSKIKILLITVFAFTFSCFIMPAWEISEFIGDFIWGTTNQGFYWGPTDSSFLFKVFGRGAYNTALYPLYDTFYDVLLAMVTTVPTALGIYFSMALRLGENKKDTQAQDKKEEAQDKKEAAVC